MSARVHLMILMAFVLGGPCLTLADPVYFNDFQQREVGTEWSNRKTDVTPVGARRFLGQFGNEMVALTLTNLPPHTCLTLSFDLFIIRSWDGIGSVAPAGGSPGPGPDVWSVAILGGETLLCTTFDNHYMAPYREVHAQSYPDPYPGVTSPPQTGAAQTNSLGYYFNFFGIGVQPVDAIYPLCFQLAHSASTCTIVFSASGLQDITDESWGLDNVRILTGREFMITFDDGPVPGRNGKPGPTENILTALEKIQVDGKPVVAGFFMVGVGCCEEECYCPWYDRLPRKGSVRENPALVRMVFNHKHVIGVHTQHHPDFNAWFKYWSVEDIEGEIFGCYGEIERALNPDNPDAVHLKKIFRPPYFCYNNKNVRDAAQALRFQVVLGAGKNEDAALDVGGKECSTACTLLKSWNQAYPCVLVFHDPLHQTADSIVEAIKCAQKEGNVLVNFNPDIVSRPESGGQPSHMLSGIAHCPVGLVVTDPQGLVLSKERNEIADGMYEEFDEDGDGDTESFFFIPEATPGQYSIQVIPEPNASPAVTYSLEVDVDGQSTVLAQDVLIRNIPQEPYTVLVGCKPVAQWTFDEGTGVVANDSAETSPGTVYGAKWVDGHIGGALLFDGVNDYVECGNAQVLSPEKMTVAFWIFVEGRTSYQYVLGKSRDMSARQDYAFSTGTSGKLEFAFGEDFGNKAALQSKDALPLGQWVHVAATRDGATAALYLNGQLENSAPYSFAVTNKDQSLRIGSIGLAEPEWAGFFKGMIDDVRIYDRALTMGEIQELYEQVSP